MGKTFKDQKNQRRNADFNTRRGELSPFDKKERHKIRQRLNEIVDKLNEDDNEKDDPKEY